MGMEKINWELQANADEIPDSEIDPKLEQDLNIPNSIEECTSWDGLYSMLKRVKRLESKTSSAIYEADLLTGLIDALRNGTLINGRKVEIDDITSTEGLRNKVRELLLADVNDEAQLEQAIRKIGKIRGSDNLEYTVEDNLALLRGIQAGTFTPAHFTRSHGLQAAYKRIMAKTKRAAA